MLLLSGCGGSEAQRSEKPTLSPAVASRLATASDAVADALDAGDVCLAAGRADALHDAVVEAINAGQVPKAFQEELSSRANELVNTVNCPSPPPPPPPPPTEEEENDNGKGKDHGKKDNNNNNNEGPTITLPPITDTTGGEGPG